MTTRSGGLLHHPAALNPWLPEPGLWFLCGTPHRNQYVAPAVMWSGPSGLLAGGGERLEGVHIVAV